MSRPALQSRPSERGLAREGARYLLVGGAAFLLDFSLYAAAIRIGDLHYLLAAPLGFAAGLAFVYWLSIGWVFAVRRLSDARLEFALFAAIGLGGMALNEAVIYAGVANAGLGYEAAKILSGAVVFAFNFSLRKALLFTRFR